MKPIFVNQRTMLLSNTENRRLGVGPTLFPSVRCPGQYPFVRN